MIFTWQTSFAHTIYRYLITLIYRCPIALTKGERSKRQPLNSLRWPIYAINSIDNTKLHSSLRYVTIEVRATGHSNCLDRVENNKVGASKCVYCTLMTSYQS